MSAKRKIFRKSGYSEYKFRDEKNLTSRVLSAVASLGLAMAMPFGAEAAVGEITPAGNGAKVVSNGNVSSVYPGAVDKANDVAIGVYKNFDVNAGKIANMYFHKQGESHETSNLVNVVGNQININGTVNAIRNNTIGGNVYFLSSQGMMVGASGAINAGSLTVMTPNKKLIYGVMTGNALDAVTDEMVNKVVDLFTDDVDVNSKVFTNFATGSNWSKIQARTIPVNPSGTITVKGKINTLDGIYMKAPFIDIKAGAQLNTATEKVNGKYQMDFSQLVNIGNTESGLSADQDNLKVSTDGASGDVVLTAVADSINFKTDGKGLIGDNIDGNNTIQASITMGKDAGINARGKAVITAEATNGTNQKVSSCRKKKSNN
jgi:filamentous hemagglutinin family protein